MISRLFYLSIVCAGLCLGAFGCDRKSSAFPLSIQAVQQLTPTNSGSITFEEQGGEILVSVTDKMGDRHLHKLELGSVSKQQALDTLKQKQAELERRP